MKEKNRCIIFLEQNGWKIDIDNPTEEYTSFFKDNCIGVDFSDERMVFIGESGDFLDLPICYYTLIGVMMEYRQIACNYNSVQK